MRFYLIAAVLGCALISSAICNVVADTEHGLIQLEDVTQNVNQQAAIVAEPLNVVSSLQIEKILSKIPQIIDEAADGQGKTAEPFEAADGQGKTAEPNEAADGQVKTVEPIEAADGQMNRAEPIEIVNSIPGVVALPENVSLQSSREPKQLIGFIPTYMLRQAMHMAQSDHDDQIDDASDEIEEERAIRRRKRFRRRNTRGHVKKSRRHKNIHKRKQKKRSNSKRKSQNRYRPLRKIKAPKTKNRRTKNKTKGRGSY